jgi:hypothetical protein
VDLPRLLWEWDHDLGRVAYRWPSQADPAARYRQPRPRTQMTHPELDLADVVHAIPNNCDWIQWNRVGMAIFAASGGSDIGSVIFDDWSLKSQKYKPDTVGERWRSYRRSPPTRTGPGSLVYLARQCGWKGRR